MLKKARLLTRQPWHAETLLVLSKAAAREEAMRTLFGTWSLRAMR